MKKIDDDSDYEHSTPKQPENTGGDIHPKAIMDQGCDDNFFRQVNIEFLVHELKAPVSIIETGVRMLLEKQAPGAALTPFQLRTLERVLRNASKTRDMLAELLEVGRAQSACFHCIPFPPLLILRQTLMAVVEAGDPVLYDQMKDLPDMNDRLTFLAQQGIRLDASPETELMSLNQDQIKFSQVAGNLIQNGFQYRRRHLLIHTARRQDVFTLAVRDDGPGIASAHHETIFQRYKQILPNDGIARSGHGLGLAVARILARSMGGDIVVESELGQGALFRLHLPQTFPGSV
ncbi:MAG: sensor histidine kinase [Desulfobacteraceae bacterium]|nr:sensor histidine kinase [Desulfobacteraceae bacterium]